MQTEQQIESLNGNEDTGYPVLLLDSSDKATQSIVAVAEALFPEVFERFPHAWRDGFTIAVRENQPRRDTGVLFSN